MKSYDSGLATKLAVLILLGIPAVHGACVSTPTGLVCHDDLELTPGVIAAIVLAAVTAAVLLVGGAIAFVRYRRRRSQLAKTMITPGVAPPAFVIDAKVMEQEKIGDAPVPAYPVPAYLAKYDPHSKGVPPCSQPASAAGYSVFGWGGYAAAIAV